MVVGLLLLTLVFSVFLFRLLRGQIERYAQLRGRLADHRKRMHASLVERIVKESQVAACCIRKGESPKGQDCWEQARRIVTVGGSQAAAGTGQQRPAASGRPRQQDTPARP